MAVKIRLKRLGKIRSPHYRVVVMDSRTKRDGRAIEEIGLYHPTQNPSFIKIDSERAQYWLSVGAQPSEQVLALLKLTGDWQKFKGESYDESTLKQPEAKEEFVAPEKGSVIIPEAITPKGDDKEEDQAEGQAEESTDESATEENADSKEKSE
ncbi:30S ribosomal protein S16 [Auritidibacter ignavus]|uniref:30S ribosomal protein S16 n=1 Tax=Auritidibacter ignavus TaxID=678932 RepID=UPI00109C386F|nr:30S ribosomal protein S16 [Auritidibacter ignavus]WGH84139.1 30S ribosomal protein S16 [Auritidibacter ignavus]